MMRSAGGPARPSQFVTIALKAILLTALALSGFGSFAGEKTCNFLLSNKLLADHLVDLSRRQQLIDQVDPRLAALNLTLSEEKSGLCASTCVANILHAAASRLGQKIAPAQEIIRDIAIFIKKRFSIDARDGLSDKEIIATLQWMARKFKLPLEVNLATFEDQDILEEDLFLEPDSLKIINISIYRESFHSMILLHYDPETRKALLSDPMNANRLQTVSVKTGIVHPDEEAQETVKLRYQHRKPSSTYDGLIDSIIEVRVKSPGRPSR